MTDADVDARIPEPALGARDPSIEKDPQMIEFQVEGMSCQHCVAAVTKAVRALDADAHVQVELQNGLVRVESKETADRLAAAIDEAGYTVKGATARESGGL